MGSAIFLYLKEYDWTNFNERNPRFHRFIEWFSSLSFGTYLIHALLLDVFKNGYLFGITLSSTNFFGIEGHPFWCVPMYVIIVTTLSLGLIWVLTKVPGLKKLVN
jgi:hypothetical protein